MKNLNAASLPILLVVITVLYSNCNMIKDYQNIVYYKEFDIFNLKGSGVLENINKSDGVEVRYDKGMPIYIKYYRPKRTITLLIEDSFYTTANKAVYVYSTSNFNGGQPGKHRVYSSYYEEFKHLIYISLTDTLLCETKEIPASRNFHFDLYIKNENEDIVETSKGEIDYTAENARLTRKQLYQKWDVLLQEEYRKNFGKLIIIDKLPRE